MNIKPVSSDLYLIELDTFITRAFSFRVHVPFYRGVLIDSGFHWKRQALVESVEAIDMEIQAVMNTHAHEDHIGGNAAIVERFDVPVYAPAPSIPAIAHADQVPYTLTRRLMWGRPVPCDPDPADGAISGESGTLELLHTPGHSEFHHCVYDPERQWLFSGDLFLTKRPQFCAFYSNYSDLIQSIEDVLEYDIGRMFCYHRGEISKPRKALQEKRDYLISFCEDVRRQREEGKTIEQISTDLMGQEPFLLRMFGGEFSQLNVIRAALKASGEGYARSPYRIRDNK